MKKIRIIILTVLFALPVFLFAQMEVLIINSPVFKSKSRSSVRFTHGNHMAMEGVSCTDCHHRFDKGKNVLEPDELDTESKTIYCGHCHNDPSELKKAFHRACIKCHDSMVKNRKPAGPRLCGECHK